MKFVMSAKLFQQLAVIKKKLINFRKHLISTTYSNYRFLCPNPPFEELVFVQKEKPEILGENLLSKNKKELQNLT